MLPQWLTSSGGDALAGPAQRTVAELRWDNSTRTVSGWRARACASVCSPGHRWRNMRSFAVHFARWRAAAGVHVKTSVAVYQPLLRVVPCAVRAGPNPHGVHPGPHLREGLRVMRAQGLQSCSPRAHPLVGPSNVSGVLCASAAPPALATSQRCPCSTIPAPPPWTRESGPDATHAPPHAHRHAVANMTTTTAAPVHRATPRHTLCTVTTLAACEAPPPRAP